MSMVIPTSPVIGLSPSEKVLGNFATAFTAHTTSDEYGRDDELIGVFWDKADAVKAAAKKGWYGGDGNVAEVPVLVLPGDRVVLLAKPAVLLPVNTDIVEYRKKEKRRAAAKLLDTMTAEELDLLDIKVPSV